MCYSINAWLTLQENLLGNFSSKCVSCIPSRNPVRLLASEALPVVPGNVWVTSRKFLVVRISTFLSLWVYSVKHKYKQRQKFSFDPL